MGAHCRLVILCWWVCRSCIQRFRLPVPRALRQEARLKPLHRRLEAELVPRLRGDLNCVRSLKIPDHHPHL